MKATIDRDDTQPITATYQAKTISLAKARQMRHRPPSLMNLEEGDEKPTNGARKESEKAFLGIDLNNGESDLTDLEKLGLQRSRVPGPEDLTTRAVKSLRRFPRAPDLEADAFSTSRTFGTISLSERAIFAFSIPASIDYPQRPFFFALLLRAPGRNRESLYIMCHVSARKRRGGPGDETASKGSWSSRTTLNDRFSSYPIPIP